MRADFDRHADAYRAAVDRSIAFSGLPHEFFTEAKARRLLALAGHHLGDPSTLSALDVGCGLGLTDAFLAHELGALEGVDVSPEMVERARQANPSVRYELFDGARLPHADASFDLSFAVNVLHHVPPAARAPLVAEARRVTRPGGLVVVFEHNPLNPLTRRVVRSCTFDEDVELLGRRALGRILRGAGLEVVERAFILFFPSRRRLFAALERRLGWLPLGAQHVVAARRPA